MAIASGTRFDRYEILSLLGKGGMGEVYLAQDTRLKRKIALKLLPAQFTRDADRVRRFEQEAQAASALNHPNIITIYEIGEIDGTHFIATEFIEGQTLRERMKQSRLTLREALDVATQIASALAEAHGAGIIHRDIKPENVMVRSNGLVKVLDFGLAKLTEATTSATTSEVDTQAPTADGVKSETGAVLGTPRYMSPEQARGQKVDSRTDIFSLGVVLYEVIADRAPFEGPSMSDVIASILTKDPPPLSRSAPEVPAELQRIVSKALRKERDERYQGIKDLALDLKSLQQELELEAKLACAGQTELSEGGKEAQSVGQAGSEMGVADAMPTGGAATIPTTSSAKIIANEIKRHKLGLSLTLVALLIAAAVLIGITFALQRLGRTKIEQSPNASEIATVGKTTQVTFSAGLDSFPSLSPDGNAIVYSSDQSGSFEVYVKQLTPGGRELQLTSDGQQNFEPAWSPDGQRIAYYSKGRGSIWVVPALGGVTKQLTEFGSRPAWSHNGEQIAFQSSDLSDIGGSGALPPSTIWIIPSQGGTARQITHRGNPPGGHGTPAWSPDGKRLAFDAGDFNSSSVWSISVGGGELKKIAPSGSNPIYAPGGQDLYYCGGVVTAGIGISLLKVHLSPTTGEPTGEPVQIASAGPGNLMVGLTISPDGKRIAYSILKRSSNLWRVPLSPGSSEAAGPPAPFTRDTSQRNGLARFSPDGRKLAFLKWRPGTSGDIWVADADGQNLTQLTTDPSHDAQPGWFPEGDKIAFLSDRNNNHFVLWTISLTTRKEEPLLDLGEGVEFAELSPDGKQVAFNSKKGGTINVWTSAIKDGAPKQLTFDREMIGFPCWSPDGQFLACEMKRGDDDYLVILPSSGGQPTQLTFDQGKSWPHSWSPDADKIAFSGQRHGIWNIYWVSRSTKAQKQLTNYSKLNAFVRYAAWSPLGNQIVYEYVELTGNVWMVELK